MAVAPNVSVVLATHNRADSLAKSAGSVLAQTYNDIELIVVDDGSQQDIAAAVRHLDDPRVRYLRRDVQGGPAAARNTGLQAARGAYVAFQDSDDEWLLDKLALQVAVLEKASDGNMCVCGLLRRLDRRVRAYPTTRQTPRVFSFETVAASPITYTQTWLAPRAALLAAGGFKEQLQAWEDWELLLRLTDQLRIHYLDRPLVISEQGSDSITHDKASFIDAMMFVLQQHASALAPYPHLNADWHYIRARLLINATRLREARTELRRVLAHNPRHQRAWLLLLASLFGRRFVRDSLQSAGRTRKEVR